MDFNKKRSILVLATFALRLIGQGIAFFIFARVLGSSDFGIIIAILAIVSPISPLIDLGVYSIISRDIALGLSPQVIINESISTMLISIPIGILLVISVTFLIDHDANYLTTFKVSLAYILISRVSLIMAAIQNSLDRWVPIVWIEALSALLLVSLGIYGLIYEYSLAFWSETYLIISLFILIVTLFVIDIYIGKIAIRLKIPLSRIKEGLVFSIGNASQYIYTDADKIFIFKFLNPSLAGVYGVVGRLSSLALVPIGAIYSIYFPKFMIAAQQSNDELKKILRHVLKISIIYSLIVCIGVLSLANYVPFFLGSEYIKVPPTLKLLLIPIVLQIIQVPFADALTGLGYQKYRTFMQVIAAGIAIIGGFLLIPKIGLNGAVLLSGIIHTFLLIFYIYFVNKLTKRQT